MNERAVNERAVNDSGVNDVAVNDIAQPGTVGAGGTTCEQVDRSLRLHVVGAGLIGTSIALALAAAGIEVSIEDLDPGHEQRARQRVRAAMARSAAATAPGSATASVAAPVQPAASVAASVQPSAPPGSAQRRATHVVVVVAVPPAETPTVIHMQQKLNVDATIMDVASVKSRVVAELEALGTDLSNVVPTHPLGGRESPGPDDASPDLLVGRAWVLTPTPTTGRRHVEAVLEVIRVCRATPIWLNAEDHDAAVAVTSHLPQMVSSMLAAELTGLDRTGTSVAGPALVDMTRVAGSPGPMWGDIVVSNRHNVLAAVTRLGTRLEEIRVLLAGADDARLDAGVQRLLADGRRGRALLGSKHPGTAHPPAAVANPNPYDPPLGLGVAPMQPEQPGNEASAAARPPAAGSAAARAQAAAPSQAASTQAASTQAASTQAASAQAASTQAADLGSDGQPTHWLDVPVADRPGGLAALFALAASLEVNILDVRLDHAPHERSALVGLELSSDDTIRLRNALSTDG